MIKTLKNTAICSIIFIFLQFFAGASAIVFANAKEENYEAMATIELSTGRVLYEKNKDKKLPMASTTKILTAIVAIENAKNLDEKHKIPKEAVGIEGSSIYLKAGEQLSIRELLFGLMLRSGNDAAVAIAILTSGSVEEFVELMNSYLEKFGCTSSHIVTVNGLHNDEHYTTAGDLAKISAYAMKNEVFKEIVSSKEKVIDSTADSKYKCRMLKNKNKLLKMVDGANGIKTGYTIKAGKCFVGSAERNGMTVICVVLNSSNMFENCAKLLDKAFKEYSLIKLFSKGELTFVDENISSKKVIKHPVILKNDVAFPLLYEERCLIKAEAKIKENAFENTNEDFEIGCIDFKVENNLIFSEKIYTIKSEKSSSLKESFKRIIRAF